jgi:hypothetical protein
VGEKAENEVFRKNAFNISYKFDRGKKKKDCIFTQEQSSVYRYIIIDFVYLFLNVSFIYKLFK